MTTTRRRVVVIVEQEKSKGSKHVAVECKGVSARPYPQRCERNGSLRGRRPTTFNKSPMESRCVCRGQGSICSLLFFCVLSTRLFPVVPWILAPHVPRSSASKWLANLPGAKSVKTFARRRKVSSVRRSVSGSWQRTRYYAKRRFCIFSIVAEIFFPPVVLLLFRLLFKRLPRRSETSTHRYLPF